MQLAQREQRDHGADQLPAADQWPMHDPGNRDRRANGTRDRVSPLCQPFV
jgi:hypothetical protein